METEIVASSRHRRLSFLLWGTSALVAALRLSASIVSEEVFMHLNIDHLPNVLFVKLDVCLGNLLVRVVVYRLLDWDLLAVVRIQRVWLTWLPEDALEVVLEVLHFEFVYWVTVLILEARLELFTATDSLHCDFNWEFALIELRISRS